MLEYKLIERLFANERSSNQVVVEQKGLPQALQKKVTGGEPWLVAREMASWTQQV